MAVVAHEAETAPGRPIDFSRIEFQRNPVELCFQLFAGLADEFVQYYGLVSSSGNIYSTFGWDRILGVIGERCSLQFLLKVGHKSAAEFLDISLDKRLGGRPPEGDSEWLSGAHLSAVLHVVKQPLEIVWN
jgi:hypothetical protein